MGPLPRALLAALLLTLTASLLGACRREYDKPSAEAAAAKPAAAHRNDSFRRSFDGPVFAIGDLHGDLQALTNALTLAGAIDATHAWVGGRRAVIVTGDFLDRGPEDRAVCEMLDRLRDEARASAGMLVTLTGNHEIMNVAGQFHNVPTKALETFSDFASGSLQDRRLTRFPENERGRAAAFLPGGPFASRLASNPVIVMVNDTVFVHGGVLPEHVLLGIDRINEQTAAWMRGRIDGPPAFLSQDRSPVWTRLYSDDETAGRSCAVLADVLRSVDAARMVVGHTPQRKGISAMCDEKVWRIDVGLSRFYGDGTIEVLEIDQGKLRVLRQKSGSDAPTD